jgi:hypothetical protein
MEADTFVAILRISTLLGGAALFIFSLGEWQGTWAALSGLGLVLFLIAVISK